MTSPIGERFLLVGCDGMDWVSLRAAMRRGLTPNMSAMAGRGGFGSLHSDGPQDGITPWATIASGQPPLAHGVWRTMEPWVGGLRPTGKASWHRSPLWQILESAGIPTAGISWPAIAPGDEWPGFHVDASVARATGPSWDNWALPLHCCPGALRETIRDLRVHPTEIGAAQLLPLVPGLAGIDQARDVGLPVLALEMARAATIQAIATFLLSETDARAVFVHHAWLGNLRGHDTSKPPWDHVIDGAWRFLDGLIGRLVGLAGSDCNILIVSPRTQTGAGAILALRPGMKAGSEIANANLADIAPTLLAGFGLRDPGMTGEVLAGFRFEGPLEDVPPAPAGPSETDNPEQQDAELGRIVALGYAPPPSPPAAWEVESYVTEGLMLLGERPSEAGKAADAALALNPEHVQALRLRALAHVMLGQADPLPALGDALLRLAPDRPFGNLVHGAAHSLRGDAAAARPWLQAAAEGGDADTLVRVGSSWLILQRPVEAGRAFAAALAANPYEANAAIGASLAAMATNDLLGAEKPLRQFLARDPQSVPVWLQLADVMDRAGRTRDAEIARRNVTRFGGAGAA